MAGSMPMLQEIGSGLPIAQAFSRKTPMWRPTLMLTLIRVGSLDAHPVDGDVGDPRLGVLAAEQAQVEEGPGILGRALDGRDGGAQVERGLDDHFLAGSLGRGHDHRGDGVAEGAEEVESQPSGLAAEKERGAFPAGQDAGHHSHVGALDLVEHHGRADLRRRRGGGAGADLSVDAGYLQIGVDLDVGGHQLAGSLGQEIQRSAKIGDLAAIHESSLSVERPFETDYTNAELE